MSEIQDIPKAITALKFFYEQAPEYHIICAGSLLGVSLHKGISFPVGKVSFLNLYPLSFSEFLMAIGKEQYAALINSKNPDSELVKSFSQNFIEFLRYYFYIGGMPEVISTWIETNDFNEVRRIQKELLKTYENDVSKHTAEEMANKIRQVWNSVPGQLAKENKKFLYSVIKESARAREYENAVELERIIMATMPCSQFNYSGRCFSDEDWYYIRLKPQCIASILFCQSGKGSTVSDSDFMYMEYGGEIKSLQHNEKFSVTNSSFTTKNIYFKILPDIAKIFAGTQGAEVPSYTITEIDLMHIAL